MDSPKPLTKMEATVVDHLEIHRTQGLTQKELMVAIGCQESVVREACRTLLGRGRVSIMRKLKPEFRGMDAPTAPDGHRNMVADYYDAVRTDTYVLNA